MKSRVYQRTTFLLLSFAPVLANADTGGYPSNAFGSAPPSLDLPADRSLTYRESNVDRKKELLDFQKQEALRMSDENPFPSMIIPAIEPIGGKHRSGVLFGPAFRLHFYGSGYDYYRYVTFYDVGETKERIYELPVQRENCLKASEIGFASFDYTYSRAVTVNASVSYTSLGVQLGAGIADTKSHIYHAGATVQPIGGVVADHIPYFYKENWDGKTYIQLVNSRTQKTAFITKTQKAAPWWVHLFPLITLTRGPTGTAAYPMDFSVKNKEWTFSVEPRTVRSCDKGFKD